MKILISGGGIAGNAVAYWLSKLGHNVTVVERFSTLRATGLQIDLRGHGIEVMKRMGLEQEFRTKSVPEQGMQMVNDSGKRKAYFPANRSGKGQQSFTSEFEIMRGDFCRIMHAAAINKGAKYIFGTSIEAFEEKDNIIDVRFADGKTDQYDLLVGADGQGSRTRKMMLGPDTPDALYPLAGGVYVGYFTMPKPIEKGEEYMATAYQAPGNRGYMTRRSNALGLQVYIGCTSNSERLKNARGDVKKEKEALTEIFQGAGWKTKEILKSLGDSNDFYLEHMALVKLDSWSRGRVVLVGDAAYCPTANTGMGTTSGFVGAYILAGEIGRASKGINPIDALNSYERKFRPFMDQVQNGVNDGTGMPSTAFGIAVMHWFLGIASFFRVNIGAWFLKESVRDWDLPDYKEMLRD